MIAIPELAKRMGCSVDEVISISIRSEGYINKLKNNI